MMSISASTMERLIAKDLEKGAEERTTLRLAMEERERGERKKKGRAEQRSTRDGEGKEEKQPHRSRAARTFPSPVSLPSLSLLPGMRTKQLHGPPFDGASHLR